ncbi:MAG: hypothetical protein LBM04_05505 [Opitutaceae bacterium]|jgi:hypothetical protein|nr:hypothetical protein [Opitutaceae bacterium]
MIISGKTTKVFATLLFVFVCTAGIGLLPGQDDKELTKTAVYSALSGTLHKDALGPKKYDILLKTILQNQKSANKIIINELNSRTATNFVRTYSYPENVTRFTYSHDKEGAIAVLRKYKVALEKAMEDISKNIENGTVILEDSQAELNWLKGKCVIIADILSQMKANLQTPELIEKIDKSDENPGPSDTPG